MSTSVLYHGFGFVGYQYIRTEYREGAVIFTVSRKKFHLRCPVSKSKRIIKHGSHLRWFHSLPIGKKATYIKSEVTRMECKDCHIEYLIRSNCLQINLATVRLRIIRKKVNMTKAC